MTGYRQTRSDVIRELIGGPIIGLATTALMIAVIFAPLVFFIRAAVFLYSGEWIWSICDAAGRLNILGAGQCALHTSYAGFDQIANFAIAGTDATLGLLLIAGVLLGILVGLLFFAFLIGLMID